MIKRIVLICLFPNLLFAQDVTQFVNPFIGTGGHGHTFPGATAPFGFCQLSPDTRIDGSWDGCGGYHYSDSIIYGFSHTHLSGTGVSDYGDILLMPVTRKMRLDDYQYKSRFSHQKEKAQAGYYQVYLEDPKVNVELTTSRRSGFHKYTYPSNAETYVVLDLAHRDELLDSRMDMVDKHTIRGYRYSKAWATNQKVFYEIKFEQEIERIMYEPPSMGSKTHAIPLQKSKRALIKLKKSYSKAVNPAPTQTVHIKVGISGVDMKGAQKNLEAEIPHWDFKKTLKWVQDEWNKELGKIRIKEKTNDSQKMKEVSPKDLKRPDNKKVIFYSALYHCMIAPNIYSDVDHRYRGRDDKIHSTNGKFDYYTVFSLWDTYRALHPLLTILDKKRTNDFINTFIKQYEQGGRLPVWELSSNETNCMIGYHAVSVIWDAYNKGIRDYDAEKAFEAMKSIATEDIPGVQSYMKYGYVRAEDDHESVSKTLEYAYDDWCIAQMAKALGKEEDYKTFKRRSHNWINVYDPTTGFMRARKNATLMEPFSPYLVDNNYTEANSWQYSFYVPHDVTQLIAVSGGIDSFENKLNDLFEANEQTEGRKQSDITGLIGQYAHGNEPSHHIVYLYHLIGEPERGNEILNHIMDNFYTNMPNGYIGNEDCGQMSAWYVLNALNIYSFLPGDVNYISSNAVNNNFVFTKAVENNSVYTTIYSKYQTESTDTKVSYNTFLIRPGKETTNKNNNWIKKYAQIAPIPNAFIIGGQRVFKDSLKITVPMNAWTYYRLNERGEYKRFGKPIVLNETTSIELYSENPVIQRHNFDDKWIKEHGEEVILEEKGPIQKATFTKLPNDRVVFLKSKYGKTYHAGGPMGLVDGIHGTTNWRAGEWQGYQGQDFEAVIAFDKKKEITNVTATFLQDQRAWIFYPTQVDFFISTDSVNWESISSKSDWDVARDENHTSIKDVSITTNRENRPFNARYIKVVAKNYGSLPQWHPGRGNPAYIFIDEIEIE